MNVKDIKIARHLAQAEILEILMKLHDDTGIFPAEVEVHRSENTTFADDERSYFVCGVSIKFDPI